jgi:hypothetical protein
MAKYRRIAFYVDFSPFLETISPAKSSISLTHDLTPDKSGG